MAVVIPLLGRIDPYPGRKLLLVAVGSNHLYGHVACTDLWLCDIENFRSCNAQFSSALSFAKLQR